MRENNINNKQYNNYESQIIDEQQILFEDNHIIIINKKPSEIVQGDKTGDVPLSEKLKIYLKKKYNKPGNVFVGVVHRIDRPVSGIVIFAKTSKALSRINIIFNKREIKKKYLAVVEAKPQYESGNLIHYLVKEEKQNKSYVRNKDAKGASRAELNYNLIASSDNYYLLEVELLTGKHHQIRAQLAAIGCPIKGDLKYGAKRSNKYASIHLHAYKADFIHPVNQQKIEIIAPLPDETLWNYFAESL